MAKQVIRTGLGAVEFVDVVVPKADSDADYQVALGSHSAPGAWLTPDVVTVDAATVTLRLLVGNGHLDPTGGVYYRWWRKSTAPETFVRAAVDPVEVITTTGVPIETSTAWVTQEQLNDLSAILDSTANNLVANLNGVRQSAYDAYDLGSAASQDVVTETARATAAEALKADLVDGLVPPSQIPHHAASHSEGSADAVTLTQAQITGLTAALAARATRDETIGFIMAYGGS